MTRKYVFRPCDFPECDKNSAAGFGGAKGLCAAHYRQQKLGQPLREKIRPQHYPWLVEHVGYEGAECLTWPFVLTKGGRGRVSVAGKYQLAHREMCKLAHGPAPAGKPEAAHSCGKGHLGCVNPNHLRWATRQENVADTLIHGTRSQGEKHPMATLSDADVAMIKGLIGTKMQKSIAADFGVTRGVIYGIAVGHSWKHVQPAYEVRDGFLVE